MSVRTKPSELRGLRGLTAIGPISLFPFPLGFQRKERKGKETPGVDRRECEPVGLVLVKSPIFYRVRFIGSVNRTEAMRQLLCFKSKFPNHFAFTLGRYLFLLFLVSVYLTWMMKACIPWISKQLIQLLVN